MGESAASSSDGGRRKKKVWRECDSTGPEPDSESEVDVDPLHHDDPDREYIYLYCSRRSLRACKVHCDIAQHDLSPALIERRKLYIKDALVDNCS